jgi:hypothetical protein
MDAYALTFRLRTGATVDSDAPYLTSLTYILLSSLEQLSLDGFPLRSQKTRSLLVRLSSLHHTMLRPTFIAFLSHNRSSPSSSSTHTSKPSALSR